MQQTSLMKKIIWMVLCISLISPIVAGFIFYKNQETLEMYEVIANRSLPRTRQMGETLFLFRELRIQLRSLAIRSNTQNDYDRFLEGVTKALKDAEKSKTELTDMMSTNEEERAMSAEVERSWKNVTIFGAELIALAKAGDPASLDHLAELVREKCPGISSSYENSVKAMIDWQTSKAIWRNEMAKTNNEHNVKLSILFAFLGIIASITVGTLFAKKLVKTLIGNMNKLSESANAIHDRSSVVADISKRLSDASSSQAASVQQTVASIDEISTMIQRNSDSAHTSTKISDESNQAALDGKHKVELMLTSIHEISRGNDDIIEQIQNSNKEISEIVDVIKNISEKTKVINDIVFQTKLLSFNASVEAARAGEHGKGFAVVAEEVGNLASMSGKSATEISTMLSQSVLKVEDIVNNTKVVMESLTQKSADRIHLGTKSAKDCAESLDRILKNVSLANSMVKEISSASSEQATGVQEVNKAMSQLDEVTQLNTQSSQESSQAAQVLNEQVNNLNKIVSELSLIVEGKAA